MWGYRSIDMSDPIIELNAFGDADLIQEFQWADVATVDGESVETPVDLTGYSAELEIRHRDGSAAALVLTSPDGGLTITAEDGLIALRITPAQLQALLEIGERFAWKLKLTSGGGIIYRIAEGVLNVAAWP